MNSGCSKCEIITFKSHLIISGASDAEIKTPVPTSVPAALQNQHDHESFQNIQTKSYFV